MAAKRIDPLKAKEAKQKKIAIGGAVLLLALLAFQGPKTLKMLQGPRRLATLVQVDGHGFARRPVVGIGAKRRTGGVFGLDDFAQDVEPD